MKQRPDKRGLVRVAVFVTPEEGAAFSEYARRQNRTLAGQAREVMMSAVSAWQRREARRAEREASS